MKHLILIAAITALSLTSGCQKSLTQTDIESNLFTAISHGQPAEHIEALLLQADNPPKAANHGIKTVMQLSHVPSDIEKYWRFYQPNEIQKTPTIEIFEVINRYKITVLDVCVQHGGNLNQKNEDGLPFVRFSGHTPITPEMLAWLLKHGYNPNLTDETNRDYSALGFCARPGQAMLRYNQKYEMIKMLLKYGADPSVKSLGQPILQTLTTYHSDNPHAKDIINLLKSHGAKHAAELKEPAS